MASRSKGKERGRVLGGWHLWTGVAQLRKRRRNRPRMAAQRGPGRTQCALHACEFGSPNAACSRFGCGLHLTGCVVSNVKQGWSKACTVWHSEVRTLLRRCPPPLPAAAAALCRSLPPPPPLPPPRRRSAARPGATARRGAAQRSEARARRSEAQCSTAPRRAAP
eukprot:gene8815-biopygen12164